MTQVEAVYQAGVFKPLGRVDLPESQRVFLHIQPLDTGDIRAWLDRVQRLQQQLTARHGVFPDSTPDIAEDRQR